MLRDDVDRVQLGADSTRRRMRLAVQVGLLRPFLRSQLDLTVGGLSSLEGLKAPFILVANHSSDIDTAVVFGTMPPGLACRLATGAATDRFFVSKRKSFAPRLFFNIYPVDRPGHVRVGDNRGL